MFEENIRKVMEGLQQVKKEVKEEVYKGTEEIKEAVAKDITIVSSNLNSTHFESLAISTFKATTENISKLSLKFEITENNIMSATKRIVRFANDVIDSRALGKYDEVRYLQPLSKSLVEDLLPLSIEKGSATLGFIKNSNDVKFKTKLYVDETVVKVSGERDMALLDPLSGLCLWSWENENMKISFSANNCKSFIAQAATQVKAAMEAFRNMFHRCSSLRMTGFLVSGTEFVLIVGSDVRGSPITFSKSLAVQIVKEDNSVDEDACKIVGLLLLYSFEQFKYLQAKVKTLSAAALDDDENADKDEEKDFESKRKPKGDTNLTKGLTKPTKISNQENKSKKKSIGILTERNSNVMVPNTLSLENIKEHSMMHRSYVSSFW